MAKMVMFASAARRRIASAVFDGPDGFDRGSFS